MSPARTVTFGAACAGCPLRERCTTARDGRSMTIHPHEGLLRAARAQSRTAESPCGPLRGFCCRAAAARPAARRASGRLRAPEPGQPATRPSARSGLFSGVLA